MSASYFTDHFPDDVIQIQTGLGVWYQYFIFLLDGFPIQSMHVFQVETVAESTPYFIINLCPFFGIIHWCDHILQIYGISQISLSGREVANEDLSAFREYSFLATWGNIERSSFGYGFFFLGLKVESFGVASTSIIYFLSIREEITV